MVISLLQKSYQWIFVDDSHCETSWKTVLNEKGSAESDKTTSNYSYVHLPRNHLFRRLIPSTAERLVFSNGRFGWRRAGKLDVCPIEPHK